MKKIHDGHGYVEVRRYILTTTAGMILVRGMLYDMEKDSKRAAYQIMRDNEVQYLLTFECDIFEYDLIQRKLAENKCLCEKVERVCF